MNSSAAGNVRSSYDQRRFTELVQEHEARLRAYILAMVPSWSDAEDIFQATCVQLWEKLDRLESDEKFGAWAAKIAYYQVLSHRKRFVRSKMIFSDAFLDSVGCQAVSLIEGMSPRYQALARCLEQLEPQQRNVIELRYDSGMRLADVATAVGKSREATAQMLFRVRRLLQYCVERTLSAEDEP